MTEQIDSLQCSLKRSQEENRHMTAVRDKLRVKLKTQKEKAAETFERLHRDKTNEFEYFCEERKKFEDVKSHSAQIVILREMKIRQSLRYPLRA